MRNRVVANVYWGAALGLANGMRAQVPASDEASAQLRDVSASPAQNLTQALLGAAAVEISATGVSATALVRDARSSRWLYARPNSAGSDIVALSDALVTSVVATATTPLAQLEMSADATLIYGLSADGASVFIFNNADTPALSQTVHLDRPAAALRMSGDGSALVAAVADGYCVLSD